MDDNVLEYSKAYHDKYKEEFNENASNMFDDWVKESNVNVEENRKTAQDYRDAKTNLENIGDRLTKYKGRKKFMIFLIIFGILAIAVGSFLMYSNFSADEVEFGAVFGGALAAIVVGLALMISMIVVIVKKINPLISNTEEEKAKEEAHVKELYNTCLEQLKPLHALFKDSATSQLIQKTVPIIKLDPNFNMRRFDLLSGKYNLKENTSETESTVGIFSGEILGNPFIEERRISQKWGTETYTGSLVIEWTETKYYSDGSSETIHRSQTLTASVEKPIPYYDHFTRLIYANEAAPDLSFTHSPSHAERMSEKELAKLIKKGEKDLQKQEKQALKDGKSFNSMGNVEFEILFGATDRDNDIQFRLLFTPLAQKNMLHLMKTPAPFGDDFALVKSKMLNFVASEHAQNWNFNINSKEFMIYDIDMCKSAFLKFNNNYFLNLYFELAPIMSIPLYQQHKPHEYIYRDNYSRNYTSFESEVLSNALDSSMLSPGADTQSILKTSLVNKEDGCDNVLITAHYFKGFERVDYVPVRGGDGEYHNVPVPWIEYLPMINVTPVKITETKGDHNNAFNGNNATLHNLHISMIK